MTLSALVNIAEASLTSKISFYKKCNRGHIEVEQYAKDGASDAPVLECLTLEGLKMRRMDALSETTDSGRSKKSNVYWVAMGVAFKI